MMRVLIDTNIFISHLLGPHRASIIGEIFKALEEKWFTLLLPEMLLDELLLLFILPASQNMKSGYQPEHVVPDLRPCGDTPVTATQNCRAVRCPQARGRANAEPCLLNSGNLPGSVQQASYGLFITNGKNRLKTGVFTAPMPTAAPRPALTTTGPS